MGADLLLEEQPRVAAKHIQLHRARQGQDIAVFQQNEPFLGGLELELLSQGVALLVDRVLGVVHGRLHLGHLRLVLVLHLFDHIVIHHCRRRRRDRAFFALLHGKVSCFLIVSDLF